MAFIRFYGVFDSAICKCKELNLSWEIQSSIGKIVFKCLKCKVELALPYAEAKMLPIIIDGDTSNEKVEKEIQTRINSIE